MVNIKPSDIKGPLSRYQATKFEKDDFFQLISSINKVLENPLEASVLQNTFNAMWLSLEQEATSVIDKYSKEKKAPKNDDSDNELLATAPLEEILQILRQQSAILSNPEKLVPIDYLDYVQRKLNDRKRDLYTDSEMIIEELLHYLDNLFEQLEKFPNHSMISEFVQLCHFDDLVRIILHNAKSRNNKRLYSQIRSLERTYYNIIENKSEDPVAKITG